MAKFTLTILTDNPDLKARVVAAFEQVGLDIDDAGGLHQLDAFLLDEDDNLLWGTAYEPEAHDDDGEPV